MKERAEGKLQSEGTNSHPSLPKCMYLTPGHSSLEPPGSAAPSDEHPPLPYTRPTPAAPFFSLPSPDRKAVALLFRCISFTCDCDPYTEVLRSKGKKKKRCGKAENSQGIFGRIRKTATINNAGFRGVSFRNHYTLSKFPDVQGGQAIMFNS